MTNTDGHGLGAGRCPQFGQNRAHVKLDGVFGNAQSPGDLLVPLTLRQHAQNLDLSGRERLGPGIETGTGSASQEGREQRRCLRMQGHQARGDGLDGRGYLRGFSIARKHGTSTTLNGLAQVGYVWSVQEEDEPGLAWFVLLRGKSDGGVQATWCFKEDHLRVQVVDLVHEIVRSLCMTDQLDRRVARENRVQSGADNRGRSDDQYARHAAAACSPLSAPTAPCKLPTANRSRASWPSG
jgi:hypothetical protein